MKKNDFLNYIETNNSLIIQDSAKNQIAILSKNAIRSLDTDELESFSSFFEEIGVRLTEKKEGA